MILRTAKEISDAIRAYLSGEEARSIQKRTGLPNQTLYANMNKRGITQRHRVRNTKQPVVKGKNDDKSASD